MSTLLIKQQVPVPSFIKRFNRGALCALLIQLHFEKVHFEKASTPWQLLAASLKARFRPQEEMAPQMQIEKWQSNSLRDT